MQGLGIPVENRYGLRPARVPGTKTLAPLSIARDLDTKGWLQGVTTFNFHMHLPHYAVTTDDATAIHVLARQPIDMARPHPFTEAGHREFNTFLWMPPSGRPGGRRAAGRLHHLQHVVRSGREPGALLEEPRHGSVTRTREDR